MKKKVSNPGPKPVHNLADSNFLVAFDHFRTYGFTTEQDAYTYAETECKKRMRDAYVFRMCGGFAVSVTPVSMEVPQA